MDEISPILIEKYKKDRRASKTKRGTDRAPSTVNRELELLSKMFSLAIDQGLAIQNPCRKVKRYREDNERNRYLSDEEEARLLAALDNQRTGLRPLVVLAINTGMRRGELLSLRWANIDFERGLIHVMNSQREQTKTGRSRSVPMNQVVRAELQALYAKSGNTEYVFLDPRTGQPRIEPKRGFRMAGREAELKDFHFHDRGTRQPRDLPTPGWVLAGSWQSWAILAFRRRHVTHMRPMRAYDARLSRWYLWKNTNRHNSPHSEEQGLPKASVIGDKSGGRVGI
jgi:integrase